MIKRVCIANPAFIGDVLFSSRMCDALKKAHPNVEIAFLARPPAHQLVSSFPGVVKTILFDKRGTHRGIKGIKAVTAEVKAFNPDVFITPHRGWRMAFLAKSLKGQTQTVGFRGFWGFCYKNRAPFEPTASFFVRESRLLDSINVPHQQARMHCDIECRETTKEIIIAPGANWDTKRWPVASFSSLAQQLLQQGYTVALTGGPAEQTICDTIQNQTPGITNRCGETLQEAMAHMGRASLVVANDSGLAHLGRAVQTPTVVIFGPTPSEVHEIGSEPTTRAVLNPIDCAPCSSHGHVSCPKKHHRCMNDLGVAEVIEEINGLLSAVNSLEGR